MFPFFQVGQMFSLADDPRMPRYLLLGSTEDAGEEESF
jgi:hypothetical protein